MRLAAVLVFVWCSWAQLALAGPYDRLLATVERDPAYKVRMQAIRVISKRLGESKGAAPDEVLATLSRAAEQDSNELVRGLAVLVLGELRDPRARPAIERAAADRDEFVRTQAQRALEQLPAVPEVAPDSTKQLLVIASDPTPGVGAPPELEEALVRWLREGLAARAGDRFVVGDGQGGRGYHLKSSIAEIAVTPNPNGRQKVTLVIRVAIATWPENNLRHVLSAKAAAEAPTGMTMRKLQEKLLRAAVERAIQDSMAQIGGG